MNVLLPNWRIIIAVTAVAVSLWLTYKAGRQSVLHKLASDKVEVLKDGQKVDAAVYAADDDGLVCLLIECNHN